MARKCLISFFRVDAEGSSATNSSWKAFDPRRNTITQSSTSENRRGVQLSRW
jgi:hypothetical protein